MSRHRKHLVLIGVSLVVLIPFYISAYTIVDGKTRGVKPLHDPFMLNNGTRVRTLDEWETRKGEMRQILEDVEYGHMAPPPATLVPNVVSMTNITDPACIDWSLEVLVIPNASVNENNFTFEMHVYIPFDQGPGPFPCVVRVGYGFMPTPIRRGYAFCYFDNLDFDPDEDAIGHAEMAYPDYDWGSLSIWTWGFMRTVDVLLTYFPEIDPDVIISTGHSRAGKVALLAGAFDDRVSVSAPTQSGTGGAGSYLLYTPGSETLASITSATIFDYWFKRTFSSYANKERELPFDQHFLKALVAPRYLACIEARDYAWGNPEGNWATHLAALEVYAFLNVSTNIGITWRDGGHEFHDDLENSAVCDFVDAKVFGNISIMRDFSAPAYPYYGMPGEYFRWKSP
nr:hypothetical protein [Candidatus Sigynarchaeota archaeon]